jgi:hypothetical protein
MHLLVDGTPDWNQLVLGVINVPPNTSLERME